MARGVSASVQSEVAKSTLRPVVFYEGEFQSGTLRLWSGPGQVTWNSVVWTGVGRLANVSQVTETGGQKAEGIMVTLSGIPNDLVTKVLTELSHVRNATLYFGFLDASNKVVPDPVKIFVGKADVGTLKKGQKTSTVAITYERRVIDRRPKDRRFTHEDQQIDFPGDTGFRYVNALQDKVLSTGTGGGAVGGPSGGRGGGNGGGTGKNLVLDA
jgi:hypothetical protein